MKLILEINEKQTDKTLKLGGGMVLVTPPIGEDYWRYRVKLSDKQAVLGFPKFGTIGIGFAVENGSWNTNLPSSCGTMEIFGHIKKNKGDGTNPDDDVVTAIKMIQKAVHPDRH